MTRICVGKFTMIGSENGLAHSQRHYLNQCCNIVNWALRNKCQGNRNRNSYIFNHEKALENVVREMAGILSRPKCVNKIRLELCSI